MGRPGWVALAALALVAASAVPAVSTPPIAQASSPAPAPAISSPTNPAGSWSGSGGTASTFVFGPDGGYGSAGRWLFNEGTGGSVRDSSGNGQAVTLGGDAGWVAGRGGYTLWVSGNGYDTTASTVVPTNASFTVTAWAKPSAVPTYSTVVSRDGGAGIPAFDLGTRDGRWRFDRRPSRETYLYPIGIDGGTRTTVSAYGGPGGDAPVFVVPGSDGPHTLNAVALDAAAAESAPASWQFNSGPGGITSPKTVSQVGNEVALGGVAHPGTTSVTCQWRRTDVNASATIPAAHVVRA